MAETKRKPRRIKWGGREYLRRRHEILLGYAPATYPCRECGSPVIDGYVCLHCGSEEPRRRDQCTDGEAGI